MNRKCKCGGHIGSYVNIHDLGECVDCRRTYAFIDGKWENISKINFSILYRKALIKQQNLNN